MNVVKLFVIIGRIQRIVCAESVCSSFNFQVTDNKKTNRC